MASTFTFKPVEETKYDLVSLGEVMLRIDPGVDQQVDPALDMPYVVGQLPLGPLLYPLDRGLVALQQT